MADTWVTWREAWQRALYGPDGFYRGGAARTALPASVHSGPAFAHAVLALLRQHDLNAAIGAPGQRAEVGLSRDDWWADACAQLHDGVALAVDYGHLGDNRPARLSTVSYRHGRQSAACFDGHHDVTAHAAVDSLAARVGAGTRRQRSALLDLGVTGARPPLQQATTEPGVPASARPRHQRPRLRLSRL